MFISELYGVDKSARIELAKYLLEILQLYDRRNDRVIGYARAFGRFHIPASFSESLI